MKAPKTVPTEEPQTTADDPRDVPLDAPQKRRHRATYAKDKKKGGYLVRVAGPAAASFAGRKVPVILKSGDEQPEKLVALIWSGKDNETGEPVALYTFESKPREVVEEEF